MKKSFFLPISFLCIIIILVSFNNKKPINLDADRANKNALYCVPNSQTNAVFKPFIPDSLKPIIERKEFNTLSEEEKANINYAINKMKQISKGNPSDPTGWDFQTKIHNGPITLAEQTWSTCQHGTCMFLAWHRMYIYFFERILRSKMNPKKAKPALPFWDYVLNNSLPQNFKTNRVTNGFYNKNRIWIANVNPGRLGGISTINNDFKIAFRQTNFYKFQHDLENAHGKVHYAIGKVDSAYNIIGDMNDFAKAASDPIFFLHHANVDRLWEKWLNSSDTTEKFNRCNPDETKVPEWKNTKFYFYDEKGQGVEINASQITNIRKQLNYRYTNVNAPSFSSSKCNDSICPVLSKPQARISTTSLPLNSTQTKYDFSTTNSFSNIDALIKAIKNNPFKFNKIKDNVYLEFSDIIVNKYPEGVIEIYLQSEGLTPLSRPKKAYIGVLDLFTSDAVKAHGAMHPSGNTIRVEISNVIKDLGLSVANLKKIKLLFVEVNNETGAPTNLLNTDITIGKVSLAIY